MAYLCYICNQPLSPEADRLGLHRHNTCYDFPSSIQPRVADDLSDWTCDRCGKPLFANPDEGRYSIADDEDAKTGRHYVCHQGDMLKYEKAKADLKLSIGKVEVALGELRRHIRK